MKWKSTLAFFFLTLQGSTLEVQPWFCDVYSFHWTLSYVYSYFQQVQGGAPQLTSPFHSNVLYTGLEVCPSDPWSVDFDLNGAMTTADAAYFRSGALQLRYLWVDDLAGDAVSFTTGASARATTAQGLRDISCSSHAPFDFELNFSLGREFEPSFDWRWRLWGFGAVGQGTRGSPWVRAILGIEGNFRDVHTGGIYGIGSNGYGRHTTVNTDHFSGYGKIRQKSIDVDFRYSYRIGCWGTVRADYQHRFLAKACPEAVNTFAVSYLNTFSF